MEQQPHRGDIKTVLAGQIQQLQEIIATVSEILPGGNDQVTNWRQILTDLKAHLAEERCRVAVVGTVKSGKSTLINALVGQDLLKRGAGIVTAMITRIEPGETPRAVLVFKDWEEINGELNSAVSFFPSPLLLTRREPFDLRQEADRQLLAEILAQIDRRQLLHQDMMDKNFVLVQSYLEGYPQVATFLGNGDRRLELTGDEVFKHQQLVGREAAAVFLKDARLILPIPWAVAGLELGDCQGSDSPIPQHLAQVQQYLIGADLVLYVTSSRVGLRQADYKFLADLKRLRLGENCLFIINLDLAELEDLNEAQELIGGWRQELSFFQAQAPVFAFSALDLLLHKLREEGLPLSPKDLGKLLTWEADAALTAFSRQEAARFISHLRHLLHERQTELLLTGSLGRLQTVGQGIRERLQVQERLLHQDLATCQEICRRLEERQQPFTDLLYSLHQALQGAVAGLQRELRQRIDKFCDFKHGAIGPQLVQFVLAYEGNPERLELEDQLSAFLPGLYQLYQGFQQSLLQFITQEINLLLVEFIQAQEDWIISEFNRVLEPLLVPLRDALQLYYREIAALGLGGQAPQLQPPSWRKPENRQPPLFSLELTLNLRIRSEALLRFGWQLMGEAWGRLAKLWRRQQGIPPRERLHQALQQALGVIKRRTEQELAESLLNYAEGLKFRYFYPLISEMAQARENALRSELAAVLVDLAGVNEALAAESDQKALWSAKIHELQDRLTAFLAACQQPAAA